MSPGKHETAATGVAAANCTVLNYPAC